MNTNLIIYNFAPQFTEKLLNAIAEPLNIKHVEIIDPESSYTVPSGITFNHHDMRRLQHANYELDWSKITPLDNLLISKMSPYEVVFLKMLDKFNKVGVRSTYFDELDELDILKYCPTEAFISYSERKLIYLKHLRFWNHILEQKKINLFISINIPHAYIDYIIYALCKVKSIKFITFDAIYQLARIRIIENDFSMSTETLKERYNFHLKNPLAIQETSLSSNSLNFIQEQLESKDPSPIYMKAPGYGLNFHIYGGVGLLVRSLKAFVKTLINPDKHKVNFLKIYLEHEFINRNYQLQNYYKQIAETSPNLNCPYIYVALHFQPELTTTPLADSFTDQQNIIHTLAAAIPSHIRIYVKEHPAQNSLGRHPLFYKELQQFSNVTLISQQVSTFTLIEHSLAVATCTGTVGWEALFKGKPVMVFGEVCYAVAPGAFRIRNLEDCQNAIESILQGQFEWSLEKLKYFLTALEDCSCPGHLGIFGVVPSHLLEVNLDECIKNMRDMILERLSSSNFSSKQDESFSF